MDRGQFEKQWESLRKDAQHRWNKLTDGDLYQIDGMFDQMAVKLQHRYGFSKAQAEEEIQNWHWDRKVCEAPEHKQGKIREWEGDAHPSKPNERRGDAHPPKPNEWKPKKRKAG